MNTAKLPRGLTLCFSDYELQWASGGKGAKYLPLYHGRAFRNPVQPVGKLAEGGPEQGLASIIWPIVMTGSESHENPGLTRYLSKTDA